MTSVLMNREWKQKSLKVSVKSLASLLTTSFPTTVISLESPLDLYNSIMP